MAEKKSILNFFIKVEDDEQKQQPPTKEAAPKFAPVGSPAVPPTTSIPTASSPIVAQEDLEIKKQLAAAIEQANQPGYDYFEMAQAVEAQASIIPSEALRFQSTFAAVASMGVTPDKLIASAQFYLSVLQKKEDEFNKTVGQHMAEAVTSREDEVKQFDADMLAKSEQIQKLTAEINEMQQKKTAIINEVSASKSKIEQVKNNFSATMTVFVNRINSDIQKIQTYLKPAK